MTIIEAIGLIAAVAIALPFVVYVSVKLGTYAYLEGRKKFDQDNPPPVSGKVHRREDQETPRQEEG